MDENDINKEEAPKAEEPQAMGETQEAGKNSNLAITIVVVAGLLLGTVLLFGAPREDLAPAMPGPGTPQISQPIATPPTSIATEPVRPTNVPTTAVEPNPIQGIDWQWVNVTDQATSQTTTVPTPAQYTISFNTDGTINGVADCNSFSGTYSEASGLSITITTMTRAMCPEGSLDQQYLQLLGTVSSGGPDGAGNLALETAGGAQRMLFQNGGPAE